MWSVTPVVVQEVWENRVHRGTGGEDRSSGQITESEALPRLPGRMALGLADARSPWTWSCFFFPPPAWTLTGHRAKADPMGRWDNESQKITPKDSIYWHRDISWRFILYQALLIHYLISPWQWPHVAVGMERLRNLLKICGLARSRVKFKPGSI